MMKKISILFLLIILAILCTFSANAGFLVNENGYVEDEKTKIIDHVVYKLHGTTKENQYYEVFDWFDTKEASETVEEINIVPEIDGVRVTKIHPSDIEEDDDYRENKNYSVKKVAIPDTITEIGNFFFSVLDGVEELTIPASVKTIRNYSYDDLSSTTFYEMENLRKVTFLGNLENLGGFKNCKNLETVVIKGSVKKFLSRAFENCVSLKNIEFPKSIESIGDSAFKNTSITSVTIPVGTVLGHYHGSVFENCKKLTNVVFTNGKNDYFRIPNGTFLNCTSLKTVEFPKSYGSINIEYGAFRNCKALTSIKFPATCKKLTIGDDAFRNCTSLKKVTFPKTTDGVTVGYRGFRNCKNLTTLYYTSNIEKIYGGAFRDCASLTSFCVSDKIKIIGKNAFYNCKKLKTFTINGTTKYPQIYKNAFCNTAKGITFTAKNENIAKKWKSELKASGLKNMKVRYVKYYNV